MTVRDKVNRMRDEMKQRIIGHDEAVDGILMAMLSGQNAMLIGPPGVAKSEICDGWLDRIEVPDFRLPCNEFVVLEEVFGPVPFSKLKQDKFQRESIIYDDEGNREGQYMQAAKIAFMDELPRLIGPVAGAMLGILNEGHFYDGGKRREADLWCTIAAMNYLPDEEESWGACMDRFVLRYYVPRLESSESEKRHLIFTRPSGKPVPSETLTAAEFEQAVKECSEIDVTSDIMDVMLCQDMIPGLAKLSESVFNACSDRRLHKAVSVMKVAAWLRGGDKVERSDGRIYRHVMWNEIHEIDDVFNLVDEFALSAGDTMGGNTLPDELADVVRLHAERCNAALGGGMRPMEGISKATTAANGAIDDIERDWTHRLRNDPQLEIKLSHVRNARTMIAKTMETAANNVTV